MLEGERVGSAGALESERVLWKEVRKSEGRRVGALDSERVFWKEVRGVRVGALEGERVSRKDAKGLAGRK